MYKMLPFLVILQVYDLFLKYDRFDLISPSPPFWKILEFIGLPKMKAIRDFNDFRWICKSCVLQKWFLSSCRPRVWSQMRISQVHSYGARPDTRTSDLTGLVRETVHICHVWNQPLIVACQDVQTAFDSMPHEVIKDSLLGRGVKHHDVGLYMKELSCMKAHMVLPLVGRTEEFTYSGGGKQGGVETPDEWNAIIDWIMEPLVDSWTANGLGLRLSDCEDGSEGTLISHAVWADNIILLASSMEMMQCMVEQLNGAFSRFRRRTGERYFIWKPSSLECLEVGPVQAHDGGTLRVDQDGAVFEYESKEALILLGEYIDRTGSSQDSLAYNLGKAESHYLKHQKILRNKALPLCKRLGAWVQSPATVACSSSETWHLSAGLLRNLRTWELQMLRRMLGLRRRPHENYAQFNIRRQP